MPTAHSGSAVFRDRGLKMVGVLNRPAGPAGRRFPAVLFLHGMPGAEKNVDIQRALMARGVASFAPHFAGAWGSEGLYKPGDLPRQAAAALRWLSKQDFVDPRRLAVFGFSMGGWAAIHLASKARGLKAAAAVAPVGGPEMLGPGALKAMGRLSRPLRVRSARAMYADFAAAVKAQDPAASAARISCPLLLVHGDKDGVVPFLVSRRIKAAAGPKARLVRASGAAHDFLDRRAWLSRQVSSFLVGRLGR